MKKLISVFLTIAIIASMALCIPVNAGYVDVEGHWGEKAIERWDSYDVVSGKGNGIFDPDASMTRAEAAMIFSNLLGLNKMADLSGFTDVPKGAWYYEPIAKCVAAGLLTGKGNGIMDPTGLITRQEFITMYARALALTESTDAAAAKAAMQQKGFVDATAVSDWAADSFSFMVERGYVNGTTATTLSPTADINRASVMQLLDNSIALYIPANAAEDVTTVKPAEEGITLIANTDVQKIVGDADIVVIAAGAEYYNDATGEIAHNDIRVESTYMPTACLQGENITVTLAINTVTDIALVTTTGVDSEYVIEYGAQVGTATAGAEGSRITVKDGGEVENVEVTEDAKGATVTTSEDAKVTNVVLAAANTTTTIAGEVENVTVTETAKNTTVETTETAKIEKVENNATGTSITGDGEAAAVETKEDITVEVKAAVTNTNTSKDVTVTDAKGNDTAVEKDTEAVDINKETTGSGTGTGSGSTSAHTHQYAETAAWHKVKVGGVDVMEYGKKCACGAVLPVSATYELSADWTLEAPIYVAANQTLTIDLKGKNIIADGMDAIYNMGTLTLKSDGFVYPKLTDNSGNLTFTKTDAKGTVIVENGSALNGVVNKGALTVKQCAVAVCDDYGSAIVNKSGSTTVENAVLISTGLGNCAYNISGTMNLNEGTVALSATYGFAALAYGGTINVNGGSYYSLIGFPFCVCGDGTNNGQGTAKLALNARTVVDRAADYSLIEAEGGIAEVYWLAGALQTVAAQAKGDIEVIAALTEITEEGTATTANMQAYVDHFNGLAGSPD